MNVLFKYLWRSVAISKFTDGSQKIYLPFIAFAMVSNPREATYVFTCLTLGWPVFGYLSGILVDMLKVASVPFWCHAFRSGIFLSLALVAGFGDANIYHICIAAFLFSLSDVVFTVSLPKLVLELTTASNRTRGNTRLAVTHMVCAEFLGPIAGATLSAFDPVLGLSMMAVCYATAAAMLTFLLNKKPQKMPAVCKQTIVFELVTEPVRWLIGNRVLLILAVVGFGVILSWGAWFSIEPYYLIETAPRVLEKTSFGYLMAVLAIGAISAALIMEYFPIAKRNLIVLSIDVVGVVGLLVVSSVTKNPIVIGVALFLTGIGMTVWSSIVITMRQETIPTHLLGAVTGLFTVIVCSGLPAGAFVASLLVTKYSVPFAYLTMAAVSALLCPLLLVAHRRYNTGGCV